MIDDRDIEPAGSENLRRAQRDLYSVKAEFLGKPDTFHQGRTIGFTGPECSLASRTYRAFKNLPPRILVEISADERAATESLFELHHYRSVFGLIKYTAEINDNNIIIGQYIGDSFIEIDSTADAAIIHEIQDLQILCSLTPLPGWFLRGDLVSRCTLAIMRNTSVIAAGSVLSFPTYSRGICAVLSNICVVPELRRERLGLNLTAALIQKAADYGARQVFAIVEPGNLQSQNLQLRCGLVKSTSEFVFGERRRPDAMFP